jgi:hypothetical protein
VRVIQNLQPDRTRYVDPGLKLQHAAKRHDRLELEGVRPTTLAIRVSALDVLYLIAANSRALRQLLLGESELAPPSGELKAEKTGCVSALQFSVWHQVDAAARLCDSRPCVQGFF